MIKEGDAGPLSPAGFKQPQSHTPWEVQLQTETLCLSSNAFQ